MCGDLAELFVVLDAFDIAAAHSPSRAIYEVDGVPDAFPEFNTGVILFGGSPAIRAFFASWAETFTRYLERRASGEVRWLRPADKRVHVLNDQGTFREALYRSRLRVATLPPEYNCRFSAPGFVDGPVRILHGRGLDFRASPRPSMPSGPGADITSVQASSSSCAMPSPARAPTVWRTSGIHCAGAVCDGRSELPSVSCCGDAPRRLGGSHPEPGRPQDGAIPEEAPLDGYGGSRTDAPPYRRHDRPAPGSFPTNLPVCLDYPDGFYWSRILWY